MDFIVNLSQKKPPGSKGNGIKKISAGLLILRMILIGSIRGKQGRSIELIRQCFPL